MNTQLKKSAKKKKVYRKSTQRQLILEILTKRPAHLSARQVFNRVRKKKPNISLGTVYRNLNLLEELQLIKSIGHHGTKYFDSRMDKHYHILCTSCHKIADVEVSQLQDLECKVVEQTGFQLSDGKLQLFGSCPSCTSPITNELV